MARFNTFIYKGYNYDVETQLFYCNSRYYSPKLCRFISPDSIEYLDPQSINGLNLYAYCMNNPIMYSDPSGHMPEWLSTTLKIIGGVAIIAGCVVGSIFTLSVVLAGAAIGAACGWIGQSGWMKDLPAALFAGLGAKNALKHVVMIAGKESLLRMTLPVFFVGGVGGGIYGRISEYCNPYGNFIGI